MTPTSVLVWIVDRLTGFLPAPLRDGVRRALVNAAWLGLAAGAAWVASSLTSWSLPAPLAVAIGVLLTAVDKAVRSHQASSGALTRRKARRVHRANRRAVRSARTR